MDMQLPALVEDQPPVDTGALETRALACLLEYAAGSSVALPVHAGVELVEQPSVVAVPGMPHFALGLMAWQGRQLPLIDLGRYLEEGDAPAPRPFSHVLVVAYQSAAGQPLEYGALCAPFLVRMIEVADSQQCPLPGGNALWPQISISCFRHQEQAVPVLDPSRVFVNNRSIQNRRSTVHAKGGHDDGSKLSGYSQT